MAGNGEWHAECKGAWLREAKLVLEFRATGIFPSKAVCSVLLNINYQD